MPLLSYNEEKDLLAVLSINDLYLYSASKLQNLSSKNLSTHPNLISKFSISISKKLDITQISLNQSGDYFITKDSDKVYFAYIPGKKAGDVRELNLRTVYDGSVKKSMKSNFNVSNLIWLTNSRFAFLHNFKIQIFDTENNVQNISLDENHQANLLSNNNDPSLNLTFSKELNAFVFYDQISSKIIVYKLLQNSVSMNKKSNNETYLLVPEISGSSSKSQITSLNWCGQPFFSLTNGKNVHNITLCDDQENNPTQSDRLDSTIKSTAFLNETCINGTNSNLSTVFWNYESFQLNDKISHLFNDNFHINRYYLLTNNAKLFMVVLPISNSNSETDIDIDEDLPVSNVQILLESKQKNNTPNNQVQSFAISNKFIYVAFEKSDEIFIIPKQTVSIVDPKLNHSLDMSLDILDETLNSTQEPSNELYHKIQKILQRPSNQPILALSKNNLDTKFGENQENDYEMSQILRNAVNLIKENYVSKQNTAKIELKNNREILQREINVVIDSHDKLITKHNEIIENIQRASSRLQDFVDKQEILDSKIKKIRKFSTAADDMSLAEKKWLVAAKKIESRIEFYRMQIEKLQKKQSIRKKDIVDKKKRDSYSVNLDNSLHYESISRDLNQNTQALEDLVSCVRDLTLSNT